MHFLKTVVVLDGDSNQYILSHKHYIKHRQSSKVIGKDIALMLSFLSLARLLVGWLHRYGLHIDVFSQIPSIKGGYCLGSIPINPSHDIFIPL